MRDINKLVRPNITSLVPYSTARDEYKGNEAVFLDANENPYNSPYNRYPDPHQQQLKHRISELKQVSSEKIFLGNGSDEAIDLLFRAFCEPGIDNAIGIRPSYGMYRVCADINGVEFREALLSPAYQLQQQVIAKLADENSKLLFLCSPNNPTSNSFPVEEMLELVNSFNGLVVVDEAYIDFSRQPSLLEYLHQYPNLVVLQTFSKAWGMAGIRLGMAFASPEIIGILDRIKYPYNLNVLTQQVALEQISQPAGKDQWVSMILKEREILKENLLKLEVVKRILPSDANFIMAMIENSAQVFRYLIERKIIVRDRSTVALCEGFLRITIGTPEENAQLMVVLNEYTDSKRNAK